MVTELLGFRDLDPFATETSDPLLILKMDLYHVLIEEPGSNIDVPGRGIGIFDRLGATMNAQEGIHALERDIEIQFEAVEGVRSAAARITAGDAPGRYRIAIDVVADAGYLGLSYGYDGRSLRSEDLDPDPSPPTVPLVPIAPPILTSLSFDLADVAGGDEIIASGSDLAGATVEVGAGSSWTLATITDISHASVTFDFPALAAGNYFVRVTTPGGTSNSLPIEAWAPMSDADTTLVYDSVHTPYNPTTGIWLPRYVIPAGAGVQMQMETFSTGNHAANNGAPVFDGDGATQGGLIHHPGGMWTSTFLPAEVSGFFRSGSAWAVFDFTNNHSIGDSDSSGDNVWDDPSVVYHAQTFAITTGRRSSDSAPIIRAWIRDGAYKGPTVPATQGVTHSVLMRWSADGVTGSLDLSIDGALAGASYAQRAIVSGADAEYYAHPLRLGQTYPFASAATQTFAGKIRAVGMLKAKASDAFVTKLHKWARAHLGI